MAARIDFAALAGAFVVSLALAVLGCVLALTLSVWVTKMHEVLMAIYLAEGLWLLSLPIWMGLGGRWPPAWFWMANPYVLVFAPYSMPGSTGAGNFAAFVGGVLALSAGLLGLSIARMRRAVVAQSGRPERGTRRRDWSGLRRLFPSWPSPTLDGNPVLWREWHRNRPSRLARRLWAVLFFATWALAAWGTYRGIVDGVPNGSEPLNTALLLYLLFGLLMLSATAPTALAEERQRGSLDALMTAPLSTRAIVVAKWWGAYRGVLLLLPLPLYAGVFLGACWEDPPIFRVGAKMIPPVPPTEWDRLLAAVFCPLDFLASGAFIVSLGLLLATWVRRLGRAVALSVISLFLFGIGWVLLVELSPAMIDSVFGDTRLDLYENRWIFECLASFSPLFGPVNAIETLRSHHSWPREWRWAGLGLVIAIKAAVAMLLLWLTVRTFDRCLGRVAESRSPMRGGRSVVAEEPTFDVTEAVAPLT